MISAYTKKNSSLSFLPQLTSAYGCSIQEIITKSQARVINQVFIKGNGTL